MNIDFVEATGIFSGKDTPYFGHLQFWNENKVTGRLTFLIEGCRKIKLHYTPSTGIMVLSGSIMYFWQGHNFTFKKEGFVEAIDYIGQLLQIEGKIWEMQINILECGVIMEVDERPRNYIQNHREGNGMLLYSNPKDKDNFRSFNDKFAERKMYDAGRNIQYKQGIPIKQVIQEEGWNPEGHYLKWEIHYLKPELLNHGIGIRLAEIVNPHWEEIFREDIYHQYQLITPMKTLLPPSSKANFSTMDIFAIGLVESMLNEGRTIEEVKKHLYGIVNSSAILTKSDKDSRKRQINLTLAKLEQSDQSKWDISKKLAETLDLADTSTAIASDRHSDDYEDRDGSRDGGRDGSRDENQQSDSDPLYCD